MTENTSKSFEKKCLPKLSQTNANAAGIDVGARRHYVAVPPDRDQEPVRSFGCLTPELHSMAKWLKACGIETVAMESTGVYWIPVVYVLEQYGLHVSLVNARHVKHVPGRKSDVQDCQWLQELHTFGLLSGGFRPAPEIRTLRAYWRQRDNLVESSSQQIHRMQKALEQMNLQLHKELSDIMGITGQQIIRAIVKGERDPVVLARMKHPLVKSPEHVLAQALTGTYAEEHVFALKQSLELYDVYQQKISECDQQTEQAMLRLTSKSEDTPKTSPPPKKLSGKRRKNQPHFDLRTQQYRITGVDLTQIDGISAMTAQTIIAECGIDMSLYPSEKNFSSWLGLCPNNKITGGKVYSSRTRKVSNRASSSLRLAAQSLHRSSSALGAYYRRMKSRHGAPKAITATAHKLAKLIYRMLKFGKDFVDKGQSYYEARYKEQAVKNMIKRAKQIGYELVPLPDPMLVS